MSTGYCWDCRSNIRGSSAKHRTTKRHDRSTHPAPPRRSLMSYKVAEGARPAWMYVLDAMAAGYSFDPQEYDQ